MTTYRNTLIKLEGVGYSTDDKVILRNVNVEIKDIVGHGQVVALLGPSGIGKTTLFRILAGFTKPTSGSVKLEKVGEQTLTDTHLGVVGVVSQSYPLFAHRTVYDNLVCAAKMAKRENAEKLCLEYLERFGLLEHKAKYPSQLSGGQKQRVAVLQQVLCSERYILMDEPFSGLDPLSKCSVCKLIKEVADLHEENTIIVVTHGIDDAIKVADTIWLMGRDRDAAGNIIPGAYIKQTIDLKDRGITWRCCTEDNPVVIALQKEIRKQFEVL